MRTRLAPASVCLFASWFQVGARSTVMKATSRFSRSSAGLLLALIGWMIGFIAPGYGQNRSGSATDTTALTALPTWTPTGNLNTRRGMHTATLLPNGKVLVAGGFGDGLNTPLNSAELYDIATGTWSVTGSLNHAYYHHRATLLPNGKVLLVGSAPVGGLSSELYDPATGTWSSNTPPPGLVDATTLLPNGKVLMVLYTVTPASPSAHLYDPATLTWLPAATPTSVHNESTATLLQDGSVLVAGGRSDPAPGGFWEAFPVPTRAEVYHANSDSWKSVGTAVFIGLHTATLLPNGKALMAGGQWWVGVAAKLYDPVAETLTDTGDLTAARMCCHTATLLPNGKVLVAGGIGVGGADPSRSAELYDPDTGVWTSTSSLNTGRQSHTATLLPDGRVLVAGGVKTFARDVLSSAEIYDPVVAAACADFVDVGPSNAFCPNVEWLRNRSVTFGCIAGAYCPNSAVYRLTMAAFLNRLAIGLTQDVFQTQEVSGALDPDAKPIVCVTSEMASIGYPRRAYLDGIFSATVAGDLGLAVDLVASFDGGVTWQNVALHAIRVDVGANRWRNVRALGNVEVAMGQALHFGLKVSRAGLPGAATITDSVCNLRVRIDNRNSLVPPF